MESNHLCLAHLRYFWLAAAIRRGISRRTELQQKSFELVRIKSEYDIHPKNARNPREERTNEVG